MAQNIILKRSSLPGKVPDTGSLNAGELAINTYDGKIFIKRSGNVDSIQSVLTTDSTTSGSIALTQTGSFGELVVSQDANIQRDLYVIRDIITNNDIDAGGDISGSGLQVNDTLNITHEYLTFIGSANLTGSIGVLGDLTVIGAVNAQQFNINVISSSVIYQSGSTKFGDTIDDTHEFTGSIDVSGSIIINGVEVGGSANSGSFTGSFSGSFVGDGSGLRGVVSDDLPIDGWDYDSNSSASISDFNVTSSKYIIDFEWDAEVGTPVGFKTFISNKSGSTQVIPTDSGVKFVVANNVVATIDENGIQASAPAGTISGSSQLTASYDTRYVLSGSITQTTWDNIASKPGGIVSGSEQIVEILSSLNELTESYATTGSNTFVGTQTYSGSIIPATDNTYDLGSATYQWRDIYVSSGSLYIDGTKVLGSTNQELQITTDEGQSIKILEAGSDNIILQSADGDIQLKTSGGGNLLFDPTTGLIDVRGTLQIQDGYKITSSGGNSIQFGDDLGITGSITTTGNVNGVNISNLQTTFNTFTGSSNESLSGLNTYSASVREAIQITGSSVTIMGNLQVYGTQSIINSTNLEIGDNIIYLSPSGAADIDLGIVGHYNDGVYRHGGIFRDASDNGTWKVFKGLQEETTGSINTSGTGFALADFKAENLYGAINATNGVVSGSSQLVEILSSLNLYTASNDTTNTAQNNRLTTIESVTGSYETKGRSIVSGSSQIDVMSTTNIARLATTGSNVFVGNQIITGSLSTTGAISSANGTFTLLGTASDTIQNSGTPFIYLSGGGSSYTTIQQGSSKMRWWQFNGSSWIKTWDIDYNGNATLTGTFTENSSIRYKENVETIKYGLDKVLQMRGVTYDKKNTGVKEVGVIAEEVYDVLPEVVLKNEEGEIDSVSYGRIVGVLIEAIKDLKKEIEELKANR